MPAADHRHWLLNYLPSDPFSQDQTPPTSNKAKKPKKIYKPLTASVSMTDVKFREKYFPNHICLDSCKYDVIKRIAADMDFIAVDEDAKWTLMWSDASIGHTHFACIRRSQYEHEIFNSRLLPPVHKINHFPGMEDLTRKDGLALHMKRMKRIFGAAYNFTPNTWVTPMELNPLLHYAKNHRQAVYICKPNNGSQGRGIKVVTNINKICPFSSATYQTYIPKPFLIDGYKFDLRLYALVTCVDPLIVYLYADGIARFATVKYEKPTEENVNNLYMHLTNYCVNKSSETYDLEGSKRKVSKIYELIAAQGHDVSAVEAAIDDIIIKTLIAGQPTLQRNYEMTFPKETLYGSVCFELLGFDIILDEKLKPFVLEINRAPSFTMDLPVDVEVKESVLRDSFAKIYFGFKSDSSNKTLLKKNPKLRPTPLILNDPKFLNIPSGLQRQFEHESIHGRRYRLIYPNPSTYKRYNKFYSQDVAQSPQLSANALKCKLYDQLNSSHLAGLGLGTRFGVNNGAEPPGLEDDGYVTTKTGKHNGSVSTTKLKSGANAECFKTGIMSEEDKYNFFFEQNVRVMDFYTSQTRRKSSSARIWEELRNRASPRTLPPSEDVNLQAALACRDTSKIRYKPLKKPVVKPVVIVEPPKTGKLVKVPLRTGLLPPDKIKAMMKKGRMLKSVRSSSSSHT